MSHLATVEGIKSLPDAEALAIWDEISEEAKANPTPNAMWPVMLSAAILIEDRVRATGPHAEFCDRKNALMDVLLSAARRRRLEESVLDIERGARS